MNISMKYIAIGLLGLPMACAALAVGMIFGSLMGAIARNPEKSGELFTRALIGTVFAELALLMSFAVIMILIFVIA